MIETIGANAGKIWAYLVKNETATLSAIKKELDLKADSAGLAIGWLAREGKIEFNKKGASLNINLV
jgi:hypothetical protein